eukprot:6188729-Pleurochrysis_carterae.AAC.2
MAVTKVESVTGPVTGHFLLSVGLDAVDDVVGGAAGNDERAAHHVSTVRPSAATPQVDTGAQRAHLELARLVETKGEDPH